MIARESTWEDCVASRAMERASRARKEAKVVSAAPHKTNRIAARLPKDERVREKWRRTTGLTLAIEEHTDAAERHAAIARLIAKLKDCVTGTRLQHGGAESAEVTERGFGGTESGRRGTPAVPESGGRGTPAVHRVGCTTDWMPELSEWARVAGGATSLEAFCADQGISRARLNRMTLEFCNMPASELADGFRLPPLKNVLLAQLKRAAQALWGLPGSLAEQLMVEGAIARPRSLLHAGVETSRYFNAQRQDWETLRGGVIDRTEELIGSLKRLRGANPSPYPLPQGEGNTTARQGDTTALEAIAIRLGFASAARLKKACVNVLGRSLSEIERTLAREIVEYYLCAEEKVLRDAASREIETAIVCRARYLYSGDDTYRPEPPFLDRWSAAETFKPEWLAQMREQFG
ncbi:MAG TPA: hypothetical protein VEK08_09605 [Planctomycetota bacterium]|nr:hypothetical protein [Planctomycetota bacterium]